MRGIFTENSHNFWPIYCNSGLSITYDLCEKAYMFFMIVALLLNNEYMVCKSPA